MQHFRVQLIIERTHVSYWFVYELLLHIIYVNLAEDNLI